MNFELNGYAVTLVLLGVLTIIIASTVFRRLGNAIHSFGYIMLGIAIWAIANGFELACSRLEDMLFWIKIEYIGISFLPALWLVFILNFIGKDKWLNPFGLFMIFKIPVATLLLVCTNSYHHLHYSHVWVDNTGPFPMLGIEEGPWYYVHTVFFYVTLALGIYLLVTTFRNADIVFKRQNRLILLSALFPWLINLFYLLGFRPYPQFDLTPFAFILTALCIGIGLLRFGLFDIVPIARGRIIEAMQEGVLVVNTHNRVVDANEKMKLILSGYASRLVGANVNDVGIFDDTFESIIANRSKDKIEVKLSSAGAEYYFAVTITPLYEKGTVYSGYILLFRNVTERKEYEEKLRSLNQLKDRLFSIISHDLRSPLNTLMGIISMSNEGYISEEELKGLLPEISKNLGYTTSLVENLLLWSKSQLSGEKIHFSDFDIHDTAEHVIELFQKSASAKTLSLVNNIPHGTVIHADENMVQAVFRNLVSNAIKFSKLMGEVNITATVYGGYTSVCIKDNGVGIKAEDMDKIFAMENFTTRGTGDEKGTGLGLLLCKDFIEKNKGTIWAESIPGNGSKFCFKLPNNIPAV